jgi:hypothetical protein
MLVSGQSQNYIAKVGDEEGSSVFPSGDGVTRLNIQVSRTVSVLSCNEQQAPAYRRFCISTGYRVNGSITDETNKLKNMVGE